MLGRTLVLAYCASGPYRHLTELVEQNQGVWFPWGYRLSRVADVSELRPGRAVELWEVDDTRAPSSARPVAVATVDFVQTSADYVAVTLRCYQGEVTADAASVLRGVAEGRMVFSVPAGVSKDARSLAGQYV
jgi:hypothetical protein